MKVTVNGREKVLGDGATLGDALEGEGHVPGAVAAVRAPAETSSRATGDFEIETESGRMTLRLADTPDAARWRSHAGDMEGCSSRWVTRDIAAFGSFPTDIAPDRAEGSYRENDVFFSLGGSDNRATYVMVALRDHRRAYGAGAGIIGRIAEGRHVLRSMREGERVLSARPVTSETRTEDAEVTKDLSLPLGEGFSVDSRILVRLDPLSPASSEQVLIAASAGCVEVGASTGSFMSFNEGSDSSPPAERVAPRERGDVTVRSSGSGIGRVYIYRDSRQASPSHSRAGAVERGLALALLAPAGERVALATEPPRALAVGMTQAEGERFLASRGIRQRRTGDASDGAVIAGQSPEATMEALSAGEAETFGVPREMVFRVSLDDSDNVTARYFRKVTGLSHKPVGSLKAQFAFPSSPMVTFHGDGDGSKSLYPQEPFKRCRKGDIGVTNQSRPYHGLIGIRLKDSREFGPTGEEPYGTNIAGRFLGDLGPLDELEEDEEIYVTEREI
ncbi:MAG: methanogenesis marker 3 protein [Candidatus Methanoplasma sp.]|jgi:putative methanogenesis marker protein 3|nr:methanogenesis marker 3 protein [Candidatus Methanoplasma sp.]